MSHSPATNTWGRLLAEARGLARRVRLARRVTWLPLLVLAWLERHPALLVFAFGYLAVVLVPINFGWGVHWGGRWHDAPMLIIGGGVLLLGSAGFGLAHRLRRPR
ncbi:hypothetical protein GA0070608_5451 [Micromonospora peucetia]|uniref:Uncharacterized protein n=1 Tax=Micromonospora peucetia TaxID=47871 RepID=A0A1C6W3X5_9ACTN|nr:hypothetical protein GA0070608_5451 [Micromonospora peucetia]